VNDAALELESRPLPRRMLPAIEALPTFPLRDETRGHALTALEHKLAPAVRRIVQTHARATVIVPSTLTPGSRQLLLYLCPGAKAATATAAERAFRCFLAEQSSPADLSLRPLRRPDAVGARDLARRGIVVPAAIGARDRSRLPEVIGGVGAVLMQLVSSANECQPACVLQFDVPEQARLIAEISLRLPDGVPALVQGEPWAVFVDRGKGGPRHREYVVVRGIYAPTTREWQEVHVVGVSPNPRKAAPTPHIHIPDATTVSSWKGPQRARVDAVAAPLAALLLHLSAIVNDKR
jgi:hypothetical protein